MAHLNIEIKARSKRNDFIRRYLKGNGGEFKGVDHQVDTYFKVPKGRLKLREGNIENALIHYERQNIEGPKSSLVNLYRFQPAPELKEVLVKALDTLVVVDKKREIIFIDNVKFHLDSVKGLGTFMEIEAIDKDGSIGKNKLLDQCNSYLKVFGIKDKDLISHSYSDLLAREK